MMNTEKSTALNISYYEFRGIYRFFGFTIS